MTFRVIAPGRLSDLRGKRSREVIAHELRRRGHGTDAKAIWRWENGHNAPSARVISDYAAVLGCTVDELFGDDEDEEAAPMAPSLATHLHQLAQLASLLERNPDLMKELA